MLNSNIYLIGYRACGKTTVGKLLAAESGLEFADTDVMSVSFCGCEIATLVENEGWDRFRDIESNMLRETCRRKGLVVSCGGGIVLRPENRKILSESSTVYLEAPSSVLAERLEADPIHGQRPSLTGKSIVEEVRDVLEQRRNLYEESAFIKIDATRDPLDIVSELIERFNIGIKGDMA
ncbi:shikimate kinase AroL [Maridesulfovibrio bastinii]|uniref:shikimate kinase AroL n=1 Tax=Maridesulfovibrio bastinii TaxID=47157 RepID=UPI0003FE287F|nr:shikimate kinase AroL [Maridesulfovibrio bastinii]